MAELRFDVVVSQSCRLPSELSGLHSPERLAMLEPVSFLCDAPFFRREFVAPDFASWICRAPIAFVGENLFTIASAIKFL